MNFYRVSCDKNFWQFSEDNISIFPIEFYKKIFFYKKILSYQYLVLNCKFVYYFLILQKKN